PHLAPRSSAPAPAGTPADRELFRQHCVKCHGADGTGRDTRRHQPKIPNFTNASWQAQRSDAQLLTSILNGKGKEMPPWQGKISEAQARSLVGSVRAFAPTTESPCQEDYEQPSPAEPAGNAEPPRSIPEKLIAWLGKFHPAAVHFPIALL